MRTEDFAYELPERLIAQTPVEPRDSSRLMVVHRRSGEIEHRYFRDIGDYLRAGDLLVANESRVIPARLFGRKIPSGGRVELLLVHRRDERHWEALVRGRHVRAGSTLGFPDAGQPLPADAYEITAEVLEETAAGGRLLRFSQPLDPILDRLGVMPLPPYIHTPLQNAERYQTVYSRVRGSAAAPTAGLHLTPGLMARLRAQGIEFAFVLLHISMDTFRPVREEHIEDHVIHSEYAELSAAVAEQVNRAKREGRRVVAVGTTSVRVLESAARAPLSDDRRNAGDVVAPLADWTRLFIYPGFDFRVVDTLITNFHLPRSTLLALVAAFAGRDLILRAYREAIQREYRFFSFGDSMLIL